MANIVVSTACVIGSVIQAFYKRCIIPYGKNVTRNRFPAPNI